MNQQAGTQPAQYTEEIYRAVSVLLQPGDVCELRALNYEEAPARGRRTYPGTLSGYYDDFHALAAEAAAVTGRATGVYVTANPVERSLLARRCNRTKIVREGGATPDSKILERRWLLGDFDAVRDSQISATAAEREHAAHRAEACIAYLRGCGWPEPVQADSGNGAHVLYHIALPNDEASTLLVKHCLEALAARFSDDAVKLDTSVFNAGRIWKLYGTWARKGDHVPERPHRQASLLHVPSPLQVVSVEQLAALAATCPQPAEPVAPRHRTNGALFSR